ERVGDFLVHGSRRVLELALDGERALVGVAHAEYVDAAVLADDGLADADLSIHLESARTESPGEVRCDQIGVGGTRHEVTGVSRRAPGDRATARADPQARGLRRTGAGDPPPGERLRDSDPCHRSGVRASPRRYRRFPNP